jgi:hypothetical protein
MLRQYLSIYRQEDVSGEIAFVQSETTAGRNLLPPESKR